MWVCKKHDMYSMANLSQFVNGSTMLLFPKETRLCRKEMETAMDPVRRTT